MKRWTLVGILLATIVAVGAGAVGADGSTPATAKSAPNVQPPNPHARPALVSAIDTAVEAKFTPIAPCRIVDTRVAGTPIASMEARSFNALGNGSFTGQGGTSCDIPASATAISASVLTVNPSHEGYLRIWSYGTPEPLASFANYSHGGTVGKSGEIQVASGAKDFTVRSVGGKTDVVIDVTGYYISPMWAEVETNATLIRGSRVASLSHIGTGYYQVDFDRDVLNCAYTATSFEYGIEMTVEPRSLDSHGVFVAAMNHIGNIVDTRFYLTVTC